MSDKTYIGKQAAALERGKPYEEISKVIGLLEASDGEMQEVEVGDTTGRTMEVSLHGVTDALYAQQIAQNILQSVRGYVYRPYDARDALLDPAFELGDGVTIDATYSVIGAASEVCDALFSADIEAEDFSEVDNEFIFQPGAQRSIERKIAQTRASLRIDVDEIEARVDGLDGDFAALDIRVDGISSEVRGKIDGEEAQTLIEQGIDNIRLYASGEDGVAYISIYQGGVEIDGDSFTVNVNAANINGLLTADQIDTDGLTVGKLGDDDGDYAEMDTSGFSIYIDNELKTRISASSSQVIWRLGLDNPGYIIKEYTSGSGHTLTLENASQYCWLQLNFTNGRIAMNAPGGLWVNGRQIAS